MKWMGGLLLLVGCSSSASSGESCPFEGTYTFTNMLESGMCMAPADAGAQSSNSVGTVTITANGGSYVLQLAGVTGGCIATQVGSACKLQADCPVTITDAIDPTNATGTFQYSWTFTESGFTGLTTVNAPPAKSLPDGCSATDSSTGTRR